MFSGLKYHASANSSSVLLYVASSDRLTICMLIDVCYGVAVSEPIEAVDGTIYKFVVEILPTRMGEGSCGMYWRAFGRTGVSFR